MIFCVVADRTPFRLNESGKMSGENRGRVELLGADAGYRMANQAVGLQPVNYAVLYEFPISLNSLSQFTSWQRRVTVTLRMWGLDPLIDPSIARPPRESPNVRLWREASKQVRKWLAWNMPSTLIMLIESTRGPSLLADEFMDNATKVISQATRILVEPQYDVNDMMHALTCVTHCERGGWPDAKTFICRLMEFYERTERYKMEIPAFIPLSVLLQELCGEFPDLIRVKLDILQDLPNAAQDITTHDFVLICHDVLDYIEEKEPAGDIETGGPEEEDTEMMGSDERVNRGISQ